MYLHLGQDHVINTRGIVGVFDMDTASTEKRTREFLQKAEQEGVVIPLSDELPKSFVVTDIAGQVVYLSPLSSRTLESRAAHARFWQDF